MNRIETNIYEIENLEELNCEYRLHRVRGLVIGSDNYYKNRQYLIRKLSSITQSPCIAFEEDDETFIAQPEGHKELPSLLDVIGATVKIEKEPDKRKLDFTNLNSTTEKLAKRFLQFSLQTPLKNNPILWQPAAGYPFYNKTPDKRFRELSDKVDLYRGFTFRVVSLPNQKIGICVDTRNKYISRNPLPTRIGSDEFRKKYQGQNCVYEYGDYWFEIKIGVLNQLNVSEIIIGEETLYENVQRKGGNRKSQNLLKLPKDCSVLIYYNSQRQERNAPSGLCKLTYKTKHPSVKKLHNRTIKPPYMKRGEIQFVVNKYLRNLTFGLTEIKLSEKPISKNEEKVLIPDIKFGNNKVLSMRESDKAIRTPLKEFGSMKKQLLYSREAGMFIKKPFERQYVIIPQSVHQSFGEKFLEDIKKEVQHLYPPESGISYNPTVISYDDSVQKSICGIGQQIINAVKENDTEFGYGVVMIPRISSEKMKKEDELANMVMIELRKQNIFVSVIHTTTAEESFEDISTSDEESEWVLVSDRKQRGKYKGYIKNVVLNKILLLNSHWPFVLKTPLNADLTIGIDVKNNMAGFTLIYKTGEKIRFIPSESDQKEQLTRMHMYQKILEIINEEQGFRQEQGLSLHEIKNIVIHRDGILFPGERYGIKKAIKELAMEDTINKDADVTFVEIRKTSRVPLRLFKIYTLRGTQEERVSNPFVGTYMVFSEDEFFICNTGYPFLRHGTANPLHVIKLEGKLPINSIMEDIFYMSNLTWTKIDDCSRIPLSIKMTDVRLREIAGDYDADSVKFGEDKGGGENNE